MLLIVVLQITVDPCFLNSESGPKIDHGPTLSGSPQEEINLGPRARLNIFVTLVPG